MAVGVVVASVGVGGGAVVLAVAVRAVVEVGYMNLVEVQVVATGTVGSVANCGDFEADIQI